MVEIERANKAANVLGFFMPRINQNPPAQASSSSQKGGDARTLGPSGSGLSRSAGLLFLEK